MGRGYDLACYTSSKYKSDNAIKDIFISQNKELMTNIVLDPVFFFDTNTIINIKLTLL